MQHLFLVYLSFGSFFNHIGLPEHPNNLEFVAVDQIANSHGAVVLHEWNDSIEPSLLEENSSWEDPVYYPSLCPQKTGLCVLLANFFFNCIAIWYRPSCVRSYLLKCLMIVGAYSLPGLWWVTFFIHKCMYCWQKGRFIEYVFLNDLHVAACPCSAGFSIFKRGNTGNK